MADRIDILKTYKLFIDGKFPRSESGRSMEIAGVRGVIHAARASRKDLRDAVEAARGAQPKWAGATAYNRGQILYRMAEMMEGKRAEFVGAILSAGPGPKARKRGATPSAEAEVSLAIDRLVHYAGWADKFAQVLGCQNPVAGAFYNFTVPESSGVIGVIAPDESPLLALVSLLAPALAGGGSVVALGSSANPIPTAVLGEVCATSDLPPGVLNLLTGERAELLAQFAGHRDIDAIHAGNLSADECRVLREGVAENMKRVVIRDGLDWADRAACESPWWIEPMVEMKTIWHPSGA